MAKRAAALTIEEVDTGHGSSNHWSWWWPSCFVDPVVQEGKRMEPDSGLDLVVDDLPGIGRSYQMTGINGGRITVVVHHSGRRVVYGLNAGADQASAVELSDQQARKLGAVLGGAFFKPAVVVEVEAYSTTCSSTGWPSSPTRLALTSPSPSWRYVVQPG
jgi:hypothetical protein